MGTFTITHSPSFAAGITAGMMNVPISEPRHARPAPYRTSMALDFACGRSLELEASLGNVIRKARATQIPVPTLEAIYAIARMLVRSREVAP